MLFPDLTGSTIAIAGATGFVGTALARAMPAGQAKIIGLSRRKYPAAHPPFSEMRSCDLFSLIDAEKALTGVDYAFYLVHSMMPSARLTQGTFEDIDLIAADNFARAAKQCGVKQIIYLGGLTPSHGALSAHLSSRLEVERTLANYGTPLTALRAGLIIGAEGSSFQIVVRLVERLPVMVCPEWTRTKTQPIALEDVIDLLKYVLGRPSAFGKTYDIGGREVITYRDFILQTAEELRVKRWLFNFPFFTPGLSSLWVTLITGAPSALVRPLVQSLRHPMVTKNRELQEEADIPGKTFRESLREALQAAQKVKQIKPAAFNKRRSSTESAQVRSVQRLPLPKGTNAQWVAAEYLKWLPSLLWGIVSVSVTGNFCVFLLRPLRLKLLVLELSKERSSPDRALFYIRGGALVRPGGRGRLEFRELYDRRSVLAAVHEFFPRLPWIIYFLTQAQFHLWIMKAFGRHLSSFSGQT